MTELLYCKKQKRCIKLSDVTDKNDCVKPTDEDILIYYGATANEIEILTELHYICAEAYINLENYLNQLKQKYIK